MHRQVLMKLSVMKKGCNKKRRLSNIFVTQKFELTERCAREVSSAIMPAHGLAGVVYENLGRWAYRQCAYPAGRDDGTKE